MLITLFMLQTRTCTPARDPESAQRMVEAPSTTQRPASSSIIDNAVAEQLRRSYRAIPKDKGPRPDLYARAYEGGIKAAKDRSNRKPATWFGREAADH
jgi:hypothetical protein